jgi:hypothetical protein
VFVYHPYASRLHQFHIKSFIAQIIAIAFRPPSRSSIFQYSQLSSLQESLDETRGRVVVLALYLSGIKLGENVLSKDLAELDTPLVKRVDVPYSAFGEGDVLVVSDQGTKRGWCDLVSEDRCCGSVSEESLMGNEISRGSLCLNLFGGFSEHECFRLGEEV